MPPLSNSTRSDNVFEARLARGAEMESAVSVLLAGTEGRATSDQVHNFMALAAHRSLDLNDLWIAVESNAIDRIFWALLPVVSPGRTMLLLSPPLLPKEASDPAIGAVVRAACEFHREQGVQLAQLLVDPAQMSLREAYVKHGFSELAELIYLQRDVRKIPSLKPLQAGMELLNYSPRTHDLFLSTIARSYEDSLDCPGLSGLREMEDVVAGHKGGNAFDPSLWFVLMENDEACGVLLMGTAQHADVLELVYLGLTPEARGRGYGDVLVNLAFVSAVRHKRAEITLAVDSLNVPAMRLYFRHGLRRIGSRAALIRNLEAKAFP